MKTINLSGLNMNYYVETLDNGLEIYMLPYDNKKNYFISFATRFGSEVIEFKDKKQISHKLPLGIAHFLEHKMFEQESGEDPFTFFSKSGTGCNASTSFDNTQYICYGNKKFEENLEYLINFVNDPYYTDSNVNKEKGIITEEINMYEDTPEELVFELMHQKVFDGSSLAWPILGSIDNVKSFSHEKLKNYYEKNYFGENIIISVAGNFETREMLEKIKKYFGGIKNNRAEKKNLEVKYKNDFVIKKKDIEQVHICLGFPGVKNLVEKIYVLAVFNNIFGGGMSSRLYQKIREENGLAYSVFSYNYSYEKVGLFNIYAGINPSKVEDCLKFIIHEIKNLDINLISQKELAKSKEQLKAGYLLNLESSSSRMNSLGKYMVFYNKILTSEEIIDEIDKINLDDIYNLIREVFDFSKISLSCVARDNYDLKKIVGENM